MRRCSFIFLQDCVLSNYHPPVDLWCYLCCTLNSHVSMRMALNSILYCISLFFLRHLILFFITTWFFQTVFSILKMLFLLNLKELVHAYVKPEYPSCFQNYLGISAPWSCPSVNSPIVFIFHCTQFFYNFVLTLINFPCYCFSHDYILYFHDFESTRVAVASTGSAIVIVAMIY